MSNCCDSNSQVCRQDIPYPQVSPESVPSLIDNLVTALYGAFYNPQTGQGYVTKSVVNGRVVWTPACDPNNTTEIAGVPRNNGEGLLCYIIRIFSIYDPTEYIKLVGPQTITLSTFANGTISNCNFINPTGLTKANVGLGNVDNTADVNKPISGPQTTFVNNQISAALASYVPTTVANIAGGVTGSVPYQSAPSTTVLLPPGTAGFVLRSNGPGLPPSWAVNSTVSASADDINGGSAGDILYQSSGSNTSFLSPGANDYVLKSNGPLQAPSWVQKAPQATLADTATTADNISGGSYGDIMYQTAAGTTAKLGVGASGSVLQTGVAPSTPPSWVPTSTAATADSIAKRDGTGNLTANLFLGSLSGNANTATGLQPVPGLVAGTYGGVSSFPVLNISSGGQILSATNQPAPVRSTVLRFSEDKNTYSAIHRFGNAMAFIDGNNDVRFWGISQASGTSPSYTWNAFGLGAISNATNDPMGMIISPEYESAGEYAVKLYFGIRSFYILTNLGNLYASGENTNGQLGLGFSGGTTVFPRKVAISNVLDFSIAQTGNSADIVYCIAVLQDGSVFTWGNNAFGQLGNGTTTSITTPTNITAIVNANNQIQGKLFDKCYAGGQPGYCYLIERGTKKVYSCGYNGYGHLGLNNGNANVSWFTTLPTVAGSPTTADEIYTSGGTTVIVGATNHNRATSFILLNGLLYSCGSDVFGETGLGTPGTQRNVFTNVPGLSNIVDVSVSNGFGGANTGSGMSVAARDNIGRFWVWGSNSQGQLGNNPITTPTASASPIAYTDLEFFPRASNNTVTPWPSSRYIQKIKFIGGPENATYGVRCFVLDIDGQMWVAGKAGVAEFGDGYNRSADQVCFRPVRQNGVQFVDFDVTASATNQAMQIVAKDTLGNAWGWGNNISSASGSGMNNSWTSVPQRINFF